MVQVSNNCNSNDKLGRVLFHDVNNIHSVILIVGNNIFIQVQSS